MEQKQRLIDKLVTESLARESRIEEIVADWKRTVLEPLEGAVREIGDYDRWLEVTCNQLEVLINSEIE